MKLLKLLGIQNLLLLAFAQLVFRYGYLELHPNIFLVLSDWQNALLVIACVLIAAGGFLMINISGDDSNGSVISEDKAYNLYAVLTFIGVAIGFYLSNYIEKPWFSVLFIAIAGGLYLYATSLKYTAVVNNIVAAIFIGLSILLVGVFNLFPVLPTAELLHTQTLFGLIMDYSIFAFSLGLVLSVVNDIKNTDADYNAGYQTLPVVLGKGRTARVAFFLGLVPVGLVLYYCNAYLKELLPSLGYVLLFVLGPLIYFLIQVWTAKTHKEFKKLETVLRLVLFFAAASIAVITLNIQNNA